MIGRLVVAVVAGVALGALHVAPAGPQPAWSPPPSVPAATAEPLPWVSGRPMPTAQPAEAGPPAGVVAREPAADEGPHAGEPPGRATADPGGAEGVAPPEVVTSPALLDRSMPAASVDPVGLRIDDLDLDAPIGGAGVDAATGQVAVPADADSVVWYRYGPAPGEPGSAVLAGHVDHGGVEGVFFRLAELAVGARLTVALADGSGIDFDVVDRRQHAKSDLPLGELFRRGGPPTLVLVTCGGRFDPSSRSYRDNVVVTAVPARTPDHRTGGPPAP